LKKLTHTIEMIKKMGHNNKEKKMKVNEKNKNRKSERK
jgi:hypothetical protein